MAKQYVFFDVFEWSLSKGDNHQVFDLIFFDQAEEQLCTLICIQTFRHVWFSQLPVLNACFKWRWSGAAPRLISRLPKSLLLQPCCIWSRPWRCVLPASPWMLSSNTVSMIPKFLDPSKPPFSILWAIWLSTLSLLWPAVTHWAGLPGWWCGLHQLHAKWFCRLFVYFSWFHGRLFGDTTSQYDCCCFQCSCEAGWGEQCP